MHSPTRQRFEPMLETSLNRVMFLDNGTCFTDQAYELFELLDMLDLATSKLRVTNLPNNYNLRANMRQAVLRKVKILHAHGDLESIAARINVSDSHRLYNPNNQLIHGKNPKGFKWPKSGQT